MKKLLAVMAVIMAGVYAAPAQAADPDEAIKYRKYVMGTVGDHTQAFFAILQGKVPHTGELAYHARALAEAAKRTKAAFEQNTAGQGNEPTTTLDSAWDGPELQAGLDKMIDATESMAVAVETGDMASVGAIAGTLGCKGCHDNYRSK
jgi:cytochrome c556